HILTYTTSTVAEEIPPPAPPVVATPVAEPTHAPAAKFGNGRQAAVAVKASPSVRLLARKLGIDLAHVRGSGPGGRVLLDDLNVPEAPATPGEHAAPPALLNRPTAAAASRLEFGVAGSRIKLVGVRRRIAEHLVEAKRVIPHFTYVDECDLTDLVRLEDLRGGTFTITSIGGIGGLLATPIINHPEVAILGVGKAVKRPVFDPAGNVKPAEMVYLSLSFDHRVVDGAVGAVFGNALIQQLTNPARLLLPERLV